MLRRGPGSDEAAKARRSKQPEPSTSSRSGAARRPRPPLRARQRRPNPIHLHPLTARAFGFPKPIAHGMWTKARCLAALESDLPDAYTVEVELRKPIFLPGKVDFCRDGDRFAVRRSDTIHLEGTVTR